MPQNVYLCKQLMVIYSYYMNIFFKIVLTIPCGRKYSWLGGKKKDATC